MPVLLCDSKTMIWREKERFRIVAAKMDKLKGFLNIRRMDRIQNAWIRVLCRVAKGVDESVLHWFRPIEKMENDRIAKRVYVGECVGSR